MDHYTGIGGGYAYPATIPAASCSSSSGIPSGNAAAFYSLPSVPMAKKKGKQNKNGKQQNGNGGEEFGRKTNGNGGVKVPSDKYENRALKEAAQFEEDDNEDIAYLNFRLIWPLSAVSAFSVVFFLFAFFSMELIDHLSFERFALNQLLFLYGKTIGFCNNTFPYEPGMWPSFLRQVELKVLSNVSFRIAVCVPMAIRIFVAFIIRNSSRDQSLVYRNPILYWLNELSGPIAIVEAFSLALFSIITIRFDYPNLYKAMFGTFIFSATLYMFIRTMLSFSADKMEQIDLLTGMGRLLCCLLFTWTGSQLFQNHQRFIHSPGCHGYVSPGEALTEYIAIISYGIFSLLQLVDVRDVRFICYPRSCSGECEPLRPENFSVPGGKFEHCRAFEWVQRRNMANDNLNEFGEQIMEEEEFPAKFSAYRTAKIIHPQMAGGN